MSRVLLAVLVLLGVGCRETGKFECERDLQCRRGTTTGVCEPEGCAFADPTCDSGLRLDEPIGGTCVEPPPKPPGCETWHPHHVDPCALPISLGPLELADGAYQFDTDTGLLSGGSATTPASIVIAQSPPAGDAVRVITVDSLKIDSDATLAIVGSLPVIIVADTTIDVITTIDVGSSLARRPGAGADPTTCATSAGGLGMAGGTAGGGGGFAGRGGAGGDLEDASNTVLVLGGVGGTAVANLPETVRGGCVGGASAAAGPGAMPPSLPTTVARGGPGGGAIDLVARVSIALGGVIANGAGGSGSPINAGCGAAGGGSGGYIELEAPKVTAQNLFANGGSGGAGADNTHVGANGATGTTSATVAAGGVAVGCASSGGAGTAGALKDGANAGPSTCSTGGGGGGAGFIVVRSAEFTMAMTAVISPPAIVLPN